MRLFNVTSVLSSHVEWFWEVLISAQLAVLTHIHAKLQEAPRQLQIGQVLVLSHEVQEEEEHNTQYKLPAKGEQPLCRGQNRGNNL